MFRKIIDRCPRCDSELIDSTMLESGEEFKIRKCSKCWWWGD